MLATKRALISKGEHIYAHTHPYVCRIKADLMREVRALLLLVGECNAHSFACTLDTKQALLLLRFNVRALRRRNVHMDSCSHME